MRIDVWSSELRLAVRALWRHKGYSALIVLVLSAGLGCVLFMYSLVHGFVLRPLPFAAPEQLQLVGLGEPGDSEDLGGVQELDLPSLQQALAPHGAFSAYQEATVNLSDGERPERFDGAYVHGDLFGLLGVAPVLGRGFVAADQQPGAPLTVVLSDRLWRTRYLADPAIVGRSIRANAQTATVIGVMPPDFYYPWRQTIWLAARIDPAALDPDGWYEVLLRADPANHPALRGAFESWFAERQQQQPERLRPFATQVFSIGERFVSATTRNILGIMLLAVGLVLLVACANAANLMLGRAWAERQRLALQAAIGADRRRLLLQPLLQSLLLSALAALLALAVAQACAQALMAALAASDDGAPMWLRVDIDASMALSSCAIALLTGLLSGTLPAWRASRINLSEALRERGGSGGRMLQRLTHGLVVGELVLSCVVLLAAGMMIRGVAGLVHADIGVRESQQLLTARLALFPEQYPDAASQLALYQRLGDALRADPVVRDASIASVLPGLISASDRVAIEGQAEPAEGHRTVEVGLVDDHFLATYGHRLQSGRGFDTRDRAGSLPVALVDREFEQAWWPGGSALGRRIRMVPEDPASPWLEVVGVVERLHLDDLDDEHRPGVLLPLAQQPARYLSIALRLHGEPQAFAPRLAAIMRDIDPDSPLYWVRSYDQVALQATFGLQVVATLFSAFGVVALLLAGAGLYGVIAWSLALRTREIGVRRALGAPGWQLVHGLTRSTFGQVLLGLGLGVLVGVPFASLLAAQVPTLPGVGAGSVVPVLLVLLGAALLAVLVPARRALRVDPMAALRSD